MAQPTNPAAPPSLVGSLERLQKLVPAERHLVLWKPDREDFVVIGAAGLNAEQALTTEPVSFTLFEETVASGEVRWSSDGAVRLSNSLILAGIKSYLCVPVKLPGGVAVLYVDDRKTVDRFSYADLLNVNNFAQKLHPLQPRREAPPRRPAAAVAQEAAKAAPVKPIRLKLTEQASIFRSLAAFSSAGLPLLVGLQGLAEKGESKAINQLGGALQLHILRGNRISEGFEKLSSVEHLVVPLLKAAENSGRIDHIFLLLANHLDEKNERMKRLQSSLVYPGVVLSGGVAFALIVPPLVLRDQLLSYRKDGPLPLPTEMLLAMSTPWFWLILIALGFVLFKLCQLPRAPFCTPWTRRLFCAKCEVQLATTLSIQLESGVNLVPAVETAIQACDSPLVTKGAAQVSKNLRDGMELSSALRQLPGIRPMFCSMLSAGEKVGKMSEALVWCSRMSKLEYDQSLEAAIRMMEPLVMLLLGIIVGIMGVGSLLPTLRMLDQ